MSAPLPPWSPLPWDLPRSPRLWQRVGALAMDEGDHGPGAPQRALAQLAQAGLLDECVPPAFRGSDGAPDAEDFSVRALCTLRWALGFRSPLHDLMLAMQGLGSYPVTLAGSPQQQAALLPRIRSGAAIGAFALTEPEAGSDVSAICTQAQRVEGGYRLNGQKIFISNAGLATQYVLFARTDADPRKGLSALLLPADAAGLQIVPQQLLTPGHPIGALHLHDVFLPHAALLGAEGEGMSLALRTLDTFRATVAAAALGMAQRALLEARRHVLRRVQFGKPLADLQATQSALADMVVQVDAAALLVQRAAYLLDHSRAAGDPAQARAASRASSVAKLHATEAAQQVVDRALQMHGGSGLIEGSICERLYREVRALRIYEGASEVQRLIIARDLIKTPEQGSTHG